MEQDNSGHEGVVLVDGGPQGCFDCCQGLALMSMDILSQLAKSCPYERVMIDNYQCFQQLKSLLGSILEVDYYHPPMPEEMAAAALVRTNTEGL
jgi:hypothetical protein